MSTPRTIDQVVTAAADSAGVQAGQGAAVVNAATIAGLSAGDKPGTAAGTGSVALKAAPGYGGG